MDSQTFSMIGDPPLGYDGFWITDYISCWVHAERGVREPASTNTWIIASLMHRILHEGRFPDGNKKFLDSMRIRWSFDLTSLFFQSQASR